MKLRCLATGVALAGFSLVLATLIRTDNIHGTCRAVNGDGGVAAMSMNATKTTHNAAVTLAGSFDLDAGSTTTTAIHVHLSSMAGMTMQDNHGTFGGHGVLRVQRGTEVHYYEGNVYVTAASNRHPGEAGDPDVVEVNFVPAVQSNPTYHFAGHVTDGDIAVTSNFSY